MALDEALAAQQAIRTSLGMTEERTTSEANRKAGHDDQAHVDLIQ